MKTYQITLTSIQQTRMFGQLLGGLCEPDDCICLSGDLGAGKTTLTQAIAIGLGVAEHEYVSSPSFALMHEYKGVLNLYHMDFYRLSSAAEVRDLGLDEYFYQSGVSVIEWYEIAQEVLPEGYVAIKLSVLSESARRASCVAHSSSWQTKLQLLGHKMAQTD